MVNISKWNQSFNIKSTRIGFQKRKYWNRSKGILITDTFIMLYRQTRGYLKRKGIHSQEKGKREKQSYNASTNCMAILTETSKTKNKILNQTTTTLMVALIAAGTRTSSILPLLPFALSISLLFLILGELSETPPTPFFNNLEPCGFEV